MKRARRRHGDGGVTVVEFNSITAAGECVSAGEGVGIENLHKTAGGMCDIAGENDIADGVVPVG